MFNSSKKVMMEKITNEELMVSVYQEFKQNLGERNLIELLEEIKSDKYQGEINSIRYALHKGEEENANRIKTSLLGFTTSGTFGESRTKANILSYSQIIGLDFDDIPVTELDSLKTVINDCEYTFASFISPSGEGLKVFIKINSDATLHPVAYSQVANYYRELSGYDFDLKCKDITRLCFVSSDEDLYLNENSVVFEIQPEELSENRTQTIQMHKLSSEDIFDKCLKFTEIKQLYHKGNRNNFIHLFTSNANRFGINQDDTLDFCITNFDLAECEIRATVQSVYKNQIDDFAKFAKFANLQNDTFNSINESEGSNEEEGDYLKNTPKIPLSVYDNLPPILLESCQVFKENREKDVFLTGALAILSGCLPNVSGVYSGSVVYPNLFSFILAPAASGKGALKYSKALADSYHDRVITESVEAKKIYREELEAYGLLKKKNKLETKDEEPLEPKFKVVYIPANTSNARVIQHLDWNDGKGIICETEADTLGQTFKNEWGSYSDMLRKSFHHEKISISRKTEGEFVEVNEPQLSVALSGTPKQVYNIIASAEDGLFSRFIFYVFKTDAFWLDPSPKGNPINLSRYFVDQSKDVLKMVEFFEKDEMKFHLSETQWDRFNPIFSSFLQQTNFFVSEDALSVVKRLALILYRIAMIFTAIRKYKSLDYKTDIYCSDIDFETALTLVHVYIKHSIFMFENLPKNEESSVFKSGSNKQLFFDALPNEFQRKEAIEIASKFKIGERSAGTFLKSCLGKYLTQPKIGFYEKI